MIKLIDLLNESKLKNYAAAGLMAAGSLLPSTLAQTIPDKASTEVPLPKISEKTDIDKFFDALHQVETGGRYGAISGDNGKALGPFQIHKRYWRDVKNKVGGDYKDVVDYDYSKKVMMAYFNKYAKKALIEKNWEKLTKIHNGGPRGHKKQTTQQYWDKVKTFL